MFGFFNYVFNMFNKCIIGIDIYVCVFIVKRLFLFVYRFFLKKLYVGCLEMCVFYNNCNGVVS